MRQDVVVELNESRPTWWVTVATLALLSAGCDPGAVPAVSSSRSRGGTCGEVLTACECVAGFGEERFPGERVSRRACGSGVAELASCEADCGGYVSSAAICVCDGPGPALADEGGVACGRLGSRPWPGEAACEPLSPWERGLLDRLTTVWHTAPSAVCRYDPARGGEGPCGPLTAGNAFYCPDDDSLQLDGGFLDAQRARFGELAATVVLAHEWGHMQQRRLGYDRDGFDEALELHADCQAGIFVAVEAAAGHLGAGVASGAEVFTSLCEGADDQGGPAGSPAHGTCEERRAAFVRGYEGAGAHFAALCGPNPVGAMVAICGAP